MKKERRFLTSAGGGEETRKVQEKGKGRRKRKGIKWYIQHGGGPCVQLLEKEKEEKGGNKGKESERTSTLKVLFVTGDVLLRRASRQLKKGERERERGGRERRKRKKGGKEEEEEGRTVYLSLLGSLW